jgi:hypothetical protein
VIALAGAFGISRAASAAHLAPIVGAFIAGLAVSGSDVRGDVHRRLIPVAQFLVPVFFLEIGIETHLGVFAHPSVLAIAGVLSVIAIVGKIAAGAGVGRGKGNRLLVGVAMIPRGEVGLIFAGIGLANHVLDARSYGVLVAVVMVTTLVTPPMVRQLILRARRRVGSRLVAPAETLEEWLVVTAEAVELGGQPPDLLQLRIALDAAVLCATRQPGSQLLDWLSAVEPPADLWSQVEREGFVRDSRPVRAGLGGRNCPPPA